MTLKAQISSRHSPCTVSRALPSAAVSRGFLDAVAATFLSGTVALGLVVGAAAIGPVSTQNRQISV